MTFYLESCLLGLDEFLKHTCWVVGDGSRIILWLYLCCGKVPLSVQFPRHLSVVVGLNAKIGDYHSEVKRSLAAFTWGDIVRNGGA